MPNELRAIPISTGMVSGPTGYTPGFFPVLANAHSVSTHTGAAGVLASWTFACEMAPPPAFHTLDQFHLLLCGAYPGSKHDQPIPNKDISSVSGDDC